MRLIGFLAKKRCGKDTVSDYIVQNYSFTKLSLADPLKSAVGELFGFSHEQLYGDLKEDIDHNWKVSPRLVLQWFGTDVFRRDINCIIPDIKGDFWVEAMKIRYKNLTKEDPNARFAIADVRFPNEVKAIHELGGIVIKIERPGCDDSDQHESEKNIDSIKDYDILIENNGSLEELYSKIDSVILEMEKMSL